MRDLTVNLTLAFHLHLPGAPCPPAGEAPPRPGPPTFATTAQDDEDDSMMRVEATLPPKTAKDVASFELSYSVDGGPPIVATSAGGPIVLSLPAGARLSASVVQIDAAGNRSEPGEAVEFEVVDSITPGKPGVLSFAVTGQDDDEPTVDVPA